jgi:hypothetical protein
MELENLHFDVKGAIQMLAHEGLSTDARLQGRTNP